MENFKLMLNFMKLTPILVKKKKLEGLLTNNLPQKSYYSNLYRKGYCMCVNKPPQETRFNA